MKQFIAVVQGRKFLLSFSIALSVIWLIGPYVAIAGRVPFESLTNRVLASLAAYFFFFVIEYQRHEKICTGSPTIPEEIKHELQTLQETIRNVLHTLYKNAIKSFLFRYKKPWYLVLGPTHAGKSTLLNKGDLNIKGLDNLPPMLITPTKFFDWWLADDAVFIDVGGRYLREKKDNSKLNEHLFQGFFKLLKQYRRYKPINGLLLMINLQELTVNPKEQTQLKSLRHILEQLVLNFINFPIYLIITRCDTIEGFTEFFEDLGPEERNQIFGMSFPLVTQPQSLPQLFNEEYNALLTRLNERVIWRLHKEHNIDKIGTIKNFPLQMEFLKNPLAKLLNVILPNTDLNLRGIFFTSATQKDAPFDNLTQTVSRAYDIHHIYNGHRKVPSRNFFISQIFKRIIFPEAQFYGANNSDHRLQFITSLLITSFTLACVFLFYKSYHINQQTIARAQQTINLTKRLDPNIDPLIHHLNVLRTMISQLTNHQGPWYSKMGLQQTSTVKKESEEIYSKLLTTQFLTYIQRSLEIQLQNTQEENINQLYATLKAYLMLGDYQHLDKKFLSTWFYDYWHQLGKDSTDQQNLKKHLTSLLNSNFKEQSLNMQLIERKRAVLNSIPQSRLILTILQNHYQKSPIQLTPNLQVKLFNNLPTEVPGIYNIINFKHVYYTEILNTCREITHGDWVLGMKPQHPYSEIRLNQLSSEVKAIYLNEYALTWANILAKIKMDEYQTLDQITEMVELLNNPQSPLVDLINTVRDNTLPISDAIEFSQQVSSRFLSLNALSAEVLKNTNQATLTAVKHYINKITLAPDRDRASYEAAKSRMETQQADALTTLLQQAKLLPEPLQTWHTTLAAESWRIILKNTQNYLNKIWVATVYPQYQTILDKRYPLFKESTVDASLSDFANFFGNNGTMDIFFKTYLQPFVDNSRLYWEWKNIDGQKINIPQNTLEMFIRAALIQKMFFTEDARVPGINFSLVPVDLDPAVQSFTLDLDGQLVVFQKDNEQIISLSWPGPQPHHTQITFVDAQGKKTVLAETGPWSWLKIVDHSNLESTSSPKHFKLTFYLNGAAVHYELYTNGIVNPFIPGILNAFRCPENLL